MHSKITLTVSYVSAKMKAVICNLTSTWNFVLNMFDKVKHLVYFGLTVLLIKFFPLKTLGGSLILIFSYYGEKYKLHASVLRLFPLMITPSIFCISGLFLNKEVFLSSEFFCIASTFSIVPFIYKCWTEGLFFSSGWQFPQTDSLKLTRLNAIIDLINIFESGYKSTKQTILSEIIYKNLDLTLIYKNTQDISERIHILNLILQNNDKIFSTLDLETAKIYAKDPDNCIETDIFNGLIDENKSLRDVLLKLEAIKENYDNEKTSFSNHIFSGIVKISLSIMIAEGLRYGLSFGLQELDISIPYLYDILLAAPISGIFFQTKLFSSWFPGYSPPDFLRVASTEICPKNFALMSKDTMKVKAVFIPIMVSTPYSDINLTLDKPLFNQSLINEPELYEVRSSKMEEDNTVLFNITDTDFTTKKDFLKKYPTPSDFLNNYPKYSEQLSGILSYSPKEYEIFVESIYELVKDSK